MPPSMPAMGPSVKPPVCDYLLQRSRKPRETSVSLHLVMRTTRRLPRKTLDSHGAAGPQPGLTAHGHRTVDGREIPVEALDMGDSPASGNYSQNV